MKFQNVFLIHFLVLGIIVGLVRFFMLPEAAAGSSADAQDAFFGLRVILFVSGTLLTILLALIIRTRGIVEYKVENFPKLNGFNLKFSNWLFGMLWIGFLVVPIEPPSWLSHALFYFGTTASMTVLFQILIQVNLEYAAKRSGNSHGA